MIRVKSRHTIITVNLSVLFSTATAVNAFKRPFVEIIGQSSPFWLDYETKLRGDSQSPSLIQYLDRVLTPSSQT